MDCPRHPALVNEGGVDDDIAVLEGDLVHVLGLVVVHGPVAPGALGDPARGVGRGLLAGVGGGAVGTPRVSHALLLVGVAVPVVMLLLLLLPGVPARLTSLNVALRRRPPVLLVLTTLLLLLLLLLLHIQLLLLSLLLLLSQHLLLL